MKGKGLIANRLMVTSLLFTVLGIVGCTAYIDDDVWDLFSPYHVNDTLIYSTTADVFDTLVITDIYTSFPMRDNLNPFEGSFELLFVHANGRALFQKIKPLKDKQHSIEVLFPINHQFANSQSAEMRCNPEDILSISPAGKYFIPIEIKLYGPQPINSTIAARGLGVIELELTDGTIWKLVSFKRDGKEMMFERGRKANELSSKKLRLLPTLSSDQPNRVQLHHTQRRYQQS